MNKPFRSRWWRWNILVLVFARLADSSFLAEAGLEFKDYPFGEMNQAKEITSSSKATRLPQKAIENTRRFEGHGRSVTPVPTAEDIKFFALCPRIKQESRSGRGTSHQLYNFLNTLSNDVRRVSGGQESLPLYLLRNCFGWISNHNAEVQQQLPIRKLENYYYKVVKYLTELLLLSETERDQRHIGFAKSASRIIASTLKDPVLTTIDKEISERNYDRELEKYKYDLHLQLDGKLPAGIKFLPLDSAGILTIFEGCRKIVEGLKECLQGVKLPEIGEAQKETMLAWNLKENPKVEVSYIKKAFSAIEYMHRYSLISEDQMVDLLSEDHIIKIIGVHIPFLYNLKNTVEEPFFPDIDFFREDPKTFHLRKCLTDLPEKVKMEIIHAVICQAVKNAPAEYHSPEFAKFTGYFSSKTIPNDSGNLCNMELYLQRNFHNWPFHSDQAENFRFNIIFYMVDYILRYVPDEDDFFPRELTQNLNYIVPTSSTMPKFEDAFIAQKLKFKKEHLEKMLSSYRNMLSEIRLDMPFPQSQLHKEIKAATWKLNVIGNSNQISHLLKIRNRNLLKSSLWLP